MRSDTPVHAQRDRIVFSRSAGFRAHRSGQSLVESCIVLAVVCLVFMGVFQVSQLFAAKEVLQYAAGRGLRAKTVGLNRFMVRKTVRVGAIPVAGRMTSPAYTGGAAGEHALEVPRIPLYLGAETDGRLNAILDYDRWDSIRIPSPSLSLGGALHLVLGQDYPLNIAMHRAYYADDTVPLTGESFLDSHSTLYLNNEDF